MGQFRMHKTRLFLFLFQLYFVFDQMKCSIDLKLVQGIDDVEPPSISKHSALPSFSNLLKQHAHLLPPSSNLKANYSTSGNNYDNDDDDDEGNEYDEQIRIEKAYKFSINAAKTILKTNSQNNVNILQQYQMPTSFCPFVSRKACDFSSVYRTIDGSCNNLDNPKWGQAKTPYKRLLTPIYDDRLSAPKTRSYRNKRLPNARIVALEIHDSSNESQNAEYTNLLPHLTQFIHYDLGFIAPTLDSNGKHPFRCSCLNENTNECFNIEIPFEDRLNRDTQKCMPMSRSAGTFRHLACQLSQREQLNLVTHWLDLSQVYGNSKKLSNQLRLFKNGLLLSSVVSESKLEYLPFERNMNMKCQNIDKNAPCFRSGDVRTNQDLVFLAWQTVWLREHNRIARKLHELNPRWSDEQLFQEARRITIAEYQHIVYNEYLPFVLGEPVAKQYNLISSAQSQYFMSYSPRMYANVLNEFTSAAFRFDHTLARGTFTKSDTDFKQISRTEYRNVMFKTSNAFRKGGLDAYVRGAMIDRAQRFSTHLNDYLNNHYFETKSRSTPSFRYSLSAINVNRGRDHGLAGYNYYRALCGMNLALKFDDLWNVPSATRVKLESIYDHVNDVDLFTGGTSEYPIEGGVVGPTFACLIAKQFRDLKYGDRFYYENGQDKRARFTRMQLNEIKRVTLAKILCDNIDLKYVQNNPLLKAHFGTNAFVSCFNLNGVNLHAWSVSSSMGSSFNNNNNNNN